MPVGPDTLRRTAELAGLRLEPGELDDLAGPIRAILDHARALATALAEGGAEDAVRAAGGAAAAEDMVRGAPVAPLRADEPGADPLAAPPGLLAAGWTYGFFTVPRLASHDGAEGVGDEGRPSP
jgi:Asp-tRNA(Asn)/Glu-tRNA(Gln) amidotransferase C subunit